MSSDFTIIFGNLANVFENRSQTLEEVRNERILPDIVVWAFITVIVALGIVINFLSIRTLMVTKCNGTLYFLMQLSFCDIAMIFICVIELVYMNNQKWTFYPDLCPIYLGFESFTGTATIYFLATINLHGITTHNLAVKTLHRRDRIYEESRCNETDDDDDNYEVAINAQKRSLTIDYSHRKSNVSVILPVLFIWFLAASISIPFFIFGSVLPSERNPKSCGILNIDRQNGMLMQISVLLIRIVIPTLFLGVTLCFAIQKLCFAGRKLKPCGLDENANEILRLAITLSITYALFSMQKLYGSLLFEVMVMPSPIHHKYPTIDKTIGIALCMVHYVLPCLRPVAYFVLNSNFRDELRLCCSRKVPPRIRDSD